MTEPKPFKLNMLIIGLACLVGGAVSGLVPFGPTDRAAVAGRGAAQLVMILIGLGLIVGHVVKENRPAHPKHSAHPRKGSHGRHKPGHGR